MPGMIYTIFILRDLPYNDLSRIVLSQNDLFQ
jgi:hypothetical protein